VVEVLLGDEVLPKARYVPSLLDDPAPEQRFIAIDPALRSEEHAQCRLGVRTNQGLQAFDMIGIRASGLWG
jgi:hypothetical protein